MSVVWAPGSSPKQEKSSHFLWNLENKAIPPESKVKTLKSFAAQETCDEIKKVRKYHFGIGLILGKDEEADIEFESRKIVVSDQHVRDRISLLLTNYK